MKMAGLLDLQAKKVVVSKQFPETIKRFTGAHEIGHWFLHPDVVMHRDRPVNDFALSSVQRPDKEKEADYFAACYSMPARLLGDTYQELFGIGLPFVFNENTVFHLG